ncbi:BCDHK Adom3 and HATPase c domain containing prote in [Trichuris trichiura]|uniref:Protein-serine/threonine kinase n=1 Tax=Trichuris trichiura TaxID=36087 RepID=A0A077ZAI6_TRITR|nr:BCDHK Adom3 and HATPase c domain containing prote in [Trichuris trichiura]
MKEIECLPEALLNTRELRDVTRWFSETVRHIYFRHSSVVETVAEGLIDLKSGRGELPIPHRQLQYFLNRFYLMRISNRMLMNQHIMKFCKLPNFAMHDCDRIDASCNVEAVIEEAFDAAQFMCDSKYLTAPRMEKFFHNALSIGEPIHVAYSPAHLYHMTFELFKNALRATVEYWGVDKSPFELPPVKVSFFLGNSDLTIKIRDRGGGVPRGQIEKLFAYHYTTAPRPLKDDRCPMAGLGYGLPLSRLYAWYFHGDLVLTSYEGHGSDACIYIKVWPYDN